MVAFLLLGASRAVLGVAILIGALWYSTCFVPVVVTTSNVEGRTPVSSLRGTAGGSSSASGEPAVGFGIAVVLLGIAAGSRRQRSRVVSRRAQDAKSYRDYADPWLGSADLGFDPFNFSTGSIFNKGTSVAPETTYYNYRESEVKHGRFAMGAFFAIFFEDVDRDALLQQVGFSGAVDNLDATLGLDQGQAPILLLGIGVQALAEFSKQRKENDGSFLSVEYERSRCPGDLGFDPLGFGKSRSPQEFIGLHNGEVNLGRLAMIGVTAFAVKEFLIKDVGVDAESLPTLKVLGAL